MRKNEVDLYKIWKDVHTKEGKGLAATMCMYVLCVCA